MSDLVLNSSKFQPDAVDEQNRQIIAMIRMMPRDQPWWEVGIEEYRRRTNAGELTYKPRHLDDRAQDLAIPSREARRSIQCRVFTPLSGRAEGVLLNIHGGGWSVFGNDFQDPYLAHVADMRNLVAVSVGYRLAPEFPFPHGPEDCFDVAEWLVKNSRSHFGADFSFVDGSSSGAHFAALTTLHLRMAKPDFHLKGVVLKYGIFDLTYSHPSIVNAKDAIIVTHDALKFTTNAFVPGITPEQRQNPSISPFYADLQSLSPLPPALFICGTEDILVDDSVFFSAKWMMVNSKTVLKIFPGAIHGFMDFEGLPFMQEGWDNITAFLESQEDTPEKI